MLSEVIKSFSELGEEGLLTAFRNIGTDLKCGSCMEIFFTGGSTGNPHTCSFAKARGIVISSEEDLKTLERLMDRQTELEDEVNRLNIAVDQRDEEIETLEEKIEELEDDNEDLEDEVLENENPSSRRPPPHFKLPDERPGLTHKFHIGMSELGHGYLTISTYPESTDVGEVFIKMRKPPEKDVPKHLVGDTYVEELHEAVGDLSAFLRGVLDQLAIAISVGLQRGIPLETYAAKYKNMRFPPDGRTKNPEIPMCTSIVDYISRYLGAKFIGTEEWVLNKRDPL